MDTETIDDAPKPKTNQVNNILKIIHRSLSNSSFASVAMTQNPANRFSQNNSSHRSLSNSNVASIVLTKNPANRFSQATHR